MLMTHNQQAKTIFDVFSGPLCEAMPCSGDFYRKVEPCNETCYESERSAASSCVDLDRIKFIEVYYIVIIKIFNN